MIPLTVLANARPIEERAQEIFESALIVAQGDTARALYLTSMNTAELLDYTNVLEADLYVCNKDNENLRRVVGEEDESIFKRALNSNITKIAIFGLGIWVGTEVTD